MSKRARAVTTKQRPPTQVAKPAPAGLVVPPVAPGSSPRPEIVAQLEKLLELSKSGDVQDIAVTVYRESIGGFQNLAIADRHAIQIIAGVEYGKFDMILNIRRSVNGP